MLYFVDFNTVKSEADPGFPVSEGANPLIGANRASKGILVSVGGIPENFSL